MKSLSDRTLWDDLGTGGPIAENDRFLKEQLITYIGNKRRLLHTIERALRRVRKRLGKDKLRILDGFAGSGVVSRFFKQYADLLVSNDLEHYAKVIADCYLANRSAIDFDALRDHHRFVAQAAETLPVRDGFIRRLYAPKRDDAIEPGDRVFYTTDNAMRIDSMRHRLDSVPEEYRVFLLAPLLAEASVHSNTSGVFKGFYKNANGVGQFGGTNRDALTRILGKIELPFPIFSRFECDVDVRQEDANKVVRVLPELDVAYFDPPYNQHPYGSNYFMLNLIVTNQEPSEVSRVSGIAQGWQRSNYNKRSEAFKALADLVEHTLASHLLISYNSEGFISREQLDLLLRKHGRVEVIETVYNAFRGSRNLNGRSIHVKEQLFLVERH
ncbi:MAG: restriction endonuclease subunit M [Phycisphaerae bacterium]|nr:MAG: DNA adenine methylase [Planctomycetia bacterium]RIK55840.1 MAG: DNA modification methylase [Nitrospira sp.]GJQ28116.1 MAG: restriction endonuclease subunit M [Phycisphaerae bacterium]